jgi:hypothetical protein
VSESVREIMTIDDLAERIYEGVRSIHHPKDRETGRPVTVQWSALPAVVRNEYRLIASIAKKEVEHDRG